MTICNSQKCSAGIHIQGHSVAQQLQYQMNSQNLEKHNK
jgi:hypothetical protein